MDLDIDPDCSLVFDLEDEIEGGSYRVPMSNAEGELNRHAMVNRGEKFQVVADLLDVAHGTMEIGGEDMTLLIACFYFLPSRDKRFVNAVITWTFTSDDPAVDVVVEKIAPDGVWSLAPIKQSEERNLVGNASVGPSLGPITASVSGEFGMKQTTELDYHTEVTGVRRLVNRRSGGHDAVRWTLKENKATKGGICRMLQVGVLLRRTVLNREPSNPDSAPKFRGELDVVVDKGGLSEVATKVKRVWKKTEKDDAIIFQPGINRNSRIFDINTTRLRDLDLQNDIMFMSLHQSYDKIHQERELRAKKMREDGKRREEEGKRRGEEEKKHQREKKEQEMGGEEEERVVVAPTATSTTTTVPNYGLPSWIFFVGAGVIGMYMWQQLMVVLFNSH